MTIKITITFLLFSTCMCSLCFLFDCEVLYEAAADNNKNKICVIITVDVRGGTFFPVVFNCEKIQALYATHVFLIILHFYLNSRALDCYLVD